MLSCRFRRRRVLAPLAAVLLASCVNTETPRTVVAVAESGPDRRPMVSAADAVSGRVDALQPGETVIAGTGLPAAAELANRVEIRFVRTGPPVPAVTTDRPRLAAFKYLLTDGERVASSLTIDLDRPESVPGDATLRLMVLNVGDAPFMGALVVHERLDPALTFQEVTHFSRIEDQRDYKTLLSSIPLVQFYALTLDAFIELPTAATLEHEVRGDLISFRTGNLTLAPQEGVWIDFDVAITPPG